MQRIEDRTIKVRSEKHWLLYLDHSPADTKMYIFIQSNFQKAWK